MVTVNTLSGVLRHNVSAMQHDIEITHAFYSQYLLFMSWFKHSECQQYCNPDDTHTNGMLASLYRVLQVRFKPEGLDTEAH